MASNCSSYIAIRVMLLYKDKRKKDRETKRKSRSVKRNEMRIFPFVYLSLAITCANYSSLFEYVKKKKKMFLYSLLCRTVLIYSFQSYAYLTYSCISIGFQYFLIFNFLPDYKYKEKYNSSSMEIN